MLHFLYSTSSPGTSIGCDIQQAIDISAYQNIVARGNAIAEMSAQFNRVSGDSQTDTQFGILIYAFAGEPSESRVETWTALAYAETDIFTDGDVQSWEFAGAELGLPVNTDFIVIRIRAVENVYNDTAGLEFDGHYADEVTLTIVPEPSALLLLGLGGLILRRKQQHFFERSDK